MATFNHTTTPGDVLSSTVAAAAAQHFERTATTFLVPSTSSPLHLEPFVTPTPHFVTSNSVGATQHHHHHHQTNATSSSYTFVQIKREPCQVSEVTTSNNCHQQQTSSTTSTQHHGICAASSSVSASTTSKTMSTSSLTTLVKIEASSPKVQEMDKSSMATIATASGVAASTNNSNVPIGIAVARKRPQESSTTLGNSTAINVQQSLNKDMNCYGIRVADLGGVTGTSCGNIYFTGNGDFMTGSAAAEELALTAAGVQSVNRAPSTFWQYPNALPIESVISMSPATVGLQYSREASRGQVVLLPATAAALDPFQQAAAATFVWPSAYMTPQGTTSTAAATAAALQPPPNFIFPSMSPHSTLQPQPYATSLQLFGSNYSRFLSVATAAAATESQKQQKQLPPPLTPMPPAPMLVPPTALKIEEWNATEFMAAAAAATPVTAKSSQNTSTLLPVNPTAPVALNFDSRVKTTTTTTSTTNFIDFQNNNNNNQALNLMRLPTPPTSATLENSTVATPQLQSSPHILFQTTTSSPTPALLNLSTSATLQRSVGPGTVQPNCELNTNFHNNVTVGPPTPISDEVSTGLNFKPSPGEAQIVVGVPRVVATNGDAQPCTDPPPKMQDVNIQTDTPICSEDESSSCPLIAAQQTQVTNVSNAELYTNTNDSDTQQPLELTTTQVTANDFNCDEEQQEVQQQEEEIAADRAHAVECHNENEEAENEIETHEQQETGNIQTATIDMKHEFKHVKTLTQMAVLDECSGQQDHENLSRPGVEQVSPEDLTGLELLSNISTSTLVKCAPIRIKQEPIEHADSATSQNAAHSAHLMLHVGNSSTTNNLEGAPNGGECLNRMQSMHLPQPPAPVEGHLGGLNLLCALAEQRIQEEEVQSGSGGLFATTSNESDLQRHSFSFPSTQSSYQIEPSFPTMEGIELPITSGSNSGMNGLGGCGSGSSSEIAVKRKKHKHSKSSKSQGLNSLTGGKKSHGCAKKNKKKYSKEKRKHKQRLEAEAGGRPGDEELDLNDEQLQEGLQSALKTIDPTYQQRFGNKWPSPEEIFKIMESNMRMRLADITRQYRKKKRKLDEITKKKKKCSKLAAQQQLQQQQLQTQPQAAATSLMLGGASSVLGGSHSKGLGSNSSPLCDYKFPKFSNTNTTTGPTSSSPYLQTSSFMRFAEKTPQKVASFPPPDVNLNEDMKNNLSTTTSSTSIYKPVVRLEPSSLSVPTDKRGSAQRLAQKRPSTEKTSPTMSSKERKLMKQSKVSRRLIESGDDNKNMPSVIATQSQQQQQQQQQQAPKSQQRKPNPKDRELLLTNEHLYRKETRVLTDMGGLFYAGVMKPLQPPDIYAITLDGERGNKSHIMSREEIFKDTILEVTPKSVESVPVGTRLCAYWSQQYRCLYPGRAIESEAFDDGSAIKDFVSVEFDDGDSGRIRLHNIRLLLSDYPIVEYNDNPIYSLGKHKKPAMKSGNTSDSQQPSSYDQSSLAISTTSNQRLTPVSSGNEFHPSTVDLFAIRSEKKRLKNLKKKAQCAMNAVNAAVATTTNGISNSATGDSTGDCSRKHHKHKKRKKHKKHHHRKGNNREATEANENLTYMVKTSTPLVSKRELEEADNDNEIDEGDEEDEDMEVDEEVGEETMTQPGNVANGLSKAAAAQHAGATIIKQEIGASIACPSTNTMGTSAVKVKTENLDIDEETASTALMSEVSDENKADDEVEHNNSKGSKIAAFLPERQLWGWQGKSYRKAGVKGRARKQFYKTIKRGKETITVGDCAVFLSTGRPDRPYIGRIESMWETTSSNKVVRVRWFYHPEETTGCPSLKYPGALFESPHEDENDVQTISHRCEVLEFVQYFAKFGADSRQYQFIYDNNDTYYLAGYYNPRVQVLKLQDDIPTLAEQNATNTEN